MMCNATILRASSRMVIEMNILQLGDNDLIGNKFNGHDLHLYLNERGHFASHMVMRKESSDSNTHCYGSYKQEESFTKNIFYEQLFVNSDLLHLHLVHNTPFDLNYLRLLARLKPIVWTVHDPWLLSGRCIYPFDCSRWRENCGDCPSLETPFKADHDATALNLALKRTTLQGLPITYVVASRWMEKLLRSSAFFSGEKIRHVPFGIDHAIFKPVATEEARKELGIANDDIVLMFRSDASPFKGLDLIQDALLKLKVKKHVTILTVGQNGLLGSVSRRFSLREFGWLKDDRQLARLYQASDLFLMPSRQEAFGMMAIEAMSCGKLVLAIPGTALPDVINAPECGVVAEESLFAAELQQLLDNFDEIRRRGVLSLLFAQKNYNKEIYIDRILSVYADAIDSHNQTDDAAYVLQQLKEYSLKKNTIATEAAARSIVGELTSMEITLLNAVRTLKKNRFFYMIGKYIKRI